MTTKTITIKDFYQNLPELTVQANKENIIYIVVSNEKQPLFEVKPCLNQSALLNGDTTQEAYYQTLEQSLDFWHNEDDNHIFAS